MLAVSAYPEVMCLEFLPDTINYIFIAISTGQCFFVKINQIESECQLTINYQFKSTNTPKSMRQFPTYIQEVHFLDNFQLFILADNFGNLTVFDLETNASPRLMLANPFSRGALEEGDFQMEMKHQSSLQEVNKLIQTILESENGRFVSENPEHIVSNILDSFCLSKVN